ncbi:MAG: helix-turn-helix domain-containing protein [Woeseiaceae bacterium]
MIPNILIERQQALGINPVEMNILLILIKHWWQKDKIPYPSKKVIAEIIGKDVSTVQRHVRTLEEKGILKRNARFNSKNTGGGQSSNGYDLSDLVKKVAKLSTEKIKEKKERAEEDARKRRGK